MGKSRVHEALTALAARLDTLEIPYAIIDALALNAYGYLRATVDVDVLMSREGLERFRAADPAVTAIKGERFALVPLETLIELKLASGMTAPHRLRDLADVLELIRVNDLPADYQMRLHPYVRDRFAELWRAAQVTERE